jgi:putative lipoic acid-binding regulatory protein
MDQEWLKSFREKLDQHYAWPSLYMFKFIVPAGQEDAVKKLFPKHVASEKRSTRGRYTSVTVQMMMPSSEAVVSVYVQASAIDGLIAL